MRGLQVGELNKFRQEESQKDARQVAAEAAGAHYIHCPDAARSPFAPTRRRRAPKSAVEGGLEVRTARDA